jgi:TolB-like protein
MSEATGRLITGSIPVFISYAQSDLAVANEVCGALERENLKCWIAPRDVMPGEYYPDAIVHAIDAARTLVLVLSRNSSDSAHVLREVERASSKRHPIIALRIDTAPLPVGLEYFLNMSQWLDASAAAPSREFPKLIEAVRRALGRPLSVVPAIPDMPAISAKSVAVLPFLDMSEKQDQEYFSDGLAEELINLLTKIPQMRVPARTSSFYFKGKSEDIPTIARKLMVAHLLEGSVRKSGDRLRVTAQLVRADTGYHLWSETYDRRMDDVFAVQDDIASAVVKALKVKLLDEVVPHIERTQNSEAYTLYLQAESLAKRHTSEDSLRAHAYLQQALRLDPEFALAWSAVAELYTDDGVAWGKIFPAHESPGQDLDRATTDFLLGTNRMSVAAHEAGARALALRPNESGTHRVMARILWWFDFNWDAAAAELTKARTLDPANARIAEQSAQLAITMGRFTEALAFANVADRLDPLGTVNWEIGTAQFRLGELDKAAAAYRRLIELHPTKAGARFRYGLVLLCQGQPQGAMDQFDNDEPWYAATGRVLALDALGRRTEADQALALAELHWGSGMAYQISYVYAQRGEIDAAVGWLERAYLQRDAGLTAIAHDPMLRNLTDNPTFKAFLRKLKLPE